MKKSQARLNGLENQNGFDEVIPIREVIHRISKRYCLICLKNLDADLGRMDWHIPLCTKHRLAYWDGETL